ncbi:ciliary-associated calcium-binding coiled-coil protein 1 [Tiliqua scincoides]|uniref:ciliary-associated calcium-binding coiled-coil protein 1 n=1 Tax=Tiliqua scincoides TaxID=71010 RepID=UPI003462427F
MGVRRGDLEDYTCTYKQLLVQEEENITKEEDAMAWKFLSLPQITSLLEQDVAGVQKSLEVFLNLKEHKTILKEAVLLDYYVSGFCWAKALGFTPVQLGGFLTLLNLLLENLDSQQMMLEENIQELGSAVAGIGQCNTEQSGGFEFFTVDQAKAIINYLKISLFQHYALYQYLFHSPREELVLGAENFVEVVKPADSPFPAPLEEGLPYDIYSKFIALIPAAEDATKKSAEVTSSELEPEGEPTVDPLEGCTMEDVKSILDELTGDMICNLQMEFNEKLRTQEDAISVRIDKLKKA